MSEPILFLDIDGVLNSEAFFARQRGRGITIISTRQELIDPAAVAHLNRIVDTTGCHVVLSSSWRLHNLGDVIEWLRERGFRGTLFGATPRTPATRGGQIQAWLNSWDHRAVYAALDDEPDLATHEGRWVVTNYAEGLTAERADEAIRLLSQNRAWHRGSL
jgi:hypothetical protein